MSRFSYRWMPILICNVPLLFIASGCGEDAPDPCRDVDCNGVGTCVSTGGTALCECTVAGYVSQGARCTPICGDGMIVVGESCDDGMQLLFDGCDSTCQLEPGWQCQGEPSQCSVICGDGIIVDDEECDDLNMDNGDGCDFQCAVELGWECTGSPSVCERPMVIHVNHASVASNPDGLTWADAYRTVQQGVDQAHTLLQADSGTNVEIWVASGAYYPFDYPGNTITLYNYIALYGGFAGNELARAQRGHYLSAQTILDGEDQVSSIMTADQTEDVIVDGFVIRNGEGSRGGGLRMEGGRVDINNCTFSDNHADNGGAIYIYEGFVDVSNVIFLRNSTGGHGGAVNLARGGFYATNSVFACSGICLQVPEEQGSWAATAVLGTGAKSFCTAWSRSSGLTMACRLSRAGRWSSASVNS